MLKLRFCLGPAFLLLVFASCSPGQEIILDWKTRTVLSSPPEISKGATVKVTVRNVNSILYDYKVDVQLQTETPNDDLAQLVNLLPTAAPPAAAPVDLKNPTCAETAGLAVPLLKRIGDVLRTNPSLNPESGGQYKSIPLADSYDAWKKQVEPHLTVLRAYVTTLSETRCTSDPAAVSFFRDFYNPVKNKLDDLQKRVDSDHTAQGQATADKSGDTVGADVIVTETFNQVHQTNQWIKSFKFSSVLTLSGGVLLSSLENRSYVRQQVPSASGTTNALGVENGGKPTVYLMGLLNYRIPYLDSGKAGFAVSTGPVLRLGSTKSDVSSFGYFAGISGHLWRRFYVTPGVHIGEFADFPAGLTVGQPVPSSVAEITPVKRWTVRFAIGISYKTNDLGSLKKQSK